MPGTSNIDVGHKDRRHKHKKHKRHREDVDRKKSRRAEKEAGSDSPESGEIIVTSGAASPALQAKLHDGPILDGKKTNTDGPLGDRDGRAEGVIRRGSSVTNGEGRRTGSSGAVGRELSGHEDTRPCPGSTDGGNTGAGKRTQGEEEAMDPPPSRLDDPSTQRKHSIDSAGGHDERRRRHSEEGAAGPTGSTQAGHAKAKAEVEGPPGPPPLPPKKLDKSDDPRSNHTRSCSKDRARPSSACEGEALPSVRPSSSQRRVRQDADMERLEPTERDRGDDGERERNRRDRTDRVSHGEGRPSSSRDVDRDASSRGSRPVRDSSRRDEEGRRPLRDSEQRDDEGRRLGQVADNRDGGGRRPGRNADNRDDHGRSVRPSSACDPDRRWEDRERGDRGREEPSSRGRSGRDIDERGDDREWERERGRGYPGSDSQHRGSGGAERKRSYSRGQDGDRDGLGRQKRGEEGVDGRRRSDRRRGRDDSPLPDEEADQILSFGLAEKEEEEERRIEERRKRLQAIKDKHQQQAMATDSVMHPSAAFLAARAAYSDTAVGAASAASEAPPSAHAAALPAGVAERAAVPGGADEEDDGEPVEATAGDADDDGIDTEDNSDSEADGEGTVLDIFAVAEESVGAEEGCAGAGPSLPGSLFPASTGIGMEQQQKVTAAAAAALASKAAAAKAELEQEGADMFASEDPEDMFGAEAAAAAAGGQAGVGHVADGLAAAPVAALADAYDDPEGYYVFQVGEVMDKRYEVFATTGKGVFSTVVRARDTHARRDEAGNFPEVAIKLIRSNETMFKAAQTEVQVLNLLAATDPDNHKNCVRMLRHFEYRKHACMVFEPMEMNLRDLTKKYGRNKGIDIKAVKLFTYQLMIALRHLKKSRVLHADIKPDNILINHRHNRVKICDFGSAMIMGDNDVTPYLVSRFYRAPEVILGLKYEYGMDMWSIGCVVYELFTGRILFPGRDNNEMLKCMMDIKGPFTKKMLRRGAFVDKHFESDQSMSFALMEDDPISKTKVRRLIINPCIKTSFSHLLIQMQRGGGADRVMVTQLADLLDKMMSLEPEKRIDPDGAMRHPFLKDLLPVNKRKEAKQPGGK